MTPSPNAPLKLQKRFSEPVLGGYLCSLTGSGDSRFISVDQKVSSKLALAQPSREKRGYVTTAVVGILAVLSLLATRLMITATVDNYRAAGYNQGLTTTLYAAEVILQDAVIHMTTKTSDLISTEAECGNGFDTIRTIEISENNNASGEYKTTYLSESSGRHIFQIYAIATYRDFFSATVSQIASVDGSSQTVYLVPGTWTDRAASCG